MITPQTEGVSAFYQQTNQQGGDTASLLSQGVKQRRLPGGSSKKVWGLNAQPPPLASLIRTVSKGQIQASLVAQLVKNLPEMQETWVQSLGWEDPLQKGMATHSSILSWRILWTV